MSEVKSMAGAIHSFVSKDRIQPIDMEFPLPKNEAAIRQACNELANTLVMKNRDYGRGNIAEFGQLGVLVRLSDKYHRLKNLMDKNTTAAYEPVEDSWKDLAGYAIIGWLNSQGRW